MTVMGTLVPFADHACARTVSSVSKNVTPEDGEKGLTVVMPHFMPMAPVRRLLGIQSRMTISGVMCTLVLDGAAHSPRDAAGDRAANLVASLLSISSEFCYKVTSTTKSKPTIPCGCCWGWFCVFTNDDASLPSQGARVASFP